MPKSQSKRDDSLDIKDYIDENQLVYSPQYVFLVNYLNFKSFILACKTSYLDGRKYDDQVSILTNEFVECIRGYLAVVDNVIYYKRESGHWLQIDNSHNNSFCQFIEIIFSNFCESPRACKSASKFVSGLITYSSNSNDIIQFNDCYLDKNGIHEGISTHIKPKHRIDRSVYDAITSKKTSVKSKEIDDLLCHLSNHDKDSLERLLDDLSTIFIKDPKLVSKLGRFTRFYGPTGSNGKSTLAGVLKHTFGEDNVGAFKTHNFTSYNLESAVKYLMVIDDDEQGKRIPEESSSNIKSVITSGDIQVRQIRGTPYNIKPTVSLVSLSNTLPKSEDKTSGFGRRLDWFYIEDKLIKDDSWFDRLYSEESYQYLTEMLLLRALDFINRTRTNLSDKSEYMKQVDDMFRKNNISVVEFAEDYGRAWFINRTVFKANEVYKQYCEENLLSPVGPQNFTKMLSDELNLSKKRKQISETKDKDDIKTFKDSLSPEYKEYIDFGKIGMHNSANINLDDNMIENAKNELNGRRLQAFVEK